MTSVLRRCVQVFLLWLVMYAHVPSHEEYLLPKKYEDEVPCLRRLAHARTGQKHP